MSQDITKHQAKPEAPAVAHKDGVPPPAPPAAPPAPVVTRHAWRRWALCLAALLVLAGLGYYFAPSVIRAFTTVSTDDAYVNGHVTFIAPRVAGEVLEVFVDDNNRVKKGDLLVRIDPEPFQVQVNLKRAAVEVAEGDLAAAESQARGLEALARSQRWKTQTASEQVNNQIALLKARVATLGTKEAILERARADFERAKPLVQKGVMSREDFDLRQQDVRVAEAAVNQAREEVYEVRASLGLVPQPEKGKSLTDVPPDLDQTYSEVRTALAQLLQTAAQLGRPLASTDATPRQVLEDFRKLDKDGDLDRIFRELIPKVPIVMQAKAKLAQARHDLEQAQLNLSYCEVRSEIDGVVTRRNVNPGNFLQVGQQLMAVRSLREIWVDCNFKETQLADLRIGQRVELQVDMYGDRHVFEGRITGFTMGTGSTLAVLPAQNATGNFVKVVQRLPVRVELTEPNPEDAPLFIGLSVVPYVFTREPPAGPNAGARLQPYATTAPGGEAMSDAAYRPSINPWLIAIAVVVPTFMEVLDTSIANVALRYIAGGLSAAENDSEWVITSYLAANAIVLPLSGWFAAHLGRRNYFLLSILLFTVASGLCGMAGSLEQLILFRIVQGLAGGGLQPSSQAVLLDSFPPQKQGAAMTLFGIAALVAPILGPTLGGYITDNFEWRWIFLINLPVGGLALVACFAVLEDPPYLQAERARLRSRPLNFDGIGLGLLVLALACWEVLLSKGQEWDWLGDPFGRIQALLAGFLIAGALFVWRQLRIANPLVNLRPLKDRNFAAACVIIFAAFGVLYGQTTSLPGMLQSLFGYDATTSGLVLSPAGVFAVLLLPVVGFLLGRGIDARWLVVAGLLFMAAGNYWLAMLNLDISPFQVVWPRVVLIVGLSLLFAPLNVAAYQSIPKEMRGSAVGVFSLLRNEGGSVGTSVAQTIRDRRLQFHTLRLNEWLDPLNPNLSDYWRTARDGFLLQTGDAAASAQMAWQAVADKLQQQALSLAYFDVFWLFAMLGLALVPLVLFMRRSVAEKGAHVAAD